MTEEYREVSKEHWVGAKETPTVEQINTGSLQRIADATEAMAVNHTKLIDENKWLSRSRRDYIGWYEKEKRSNAALRGVITKMKDKLKEGGK